MLGKDEVGVEEWRIENVERWWEGEGGILGDIWGWVKRGGVVIYRRCRYNGEENEENVGWIGEELGGEIVGLEREGEWEIRGNVRGREFGV